MVAQWFSEILKHSVKLLLRKYLIDICEKHVIYDVRYLKSGVSLTFLASGYQGKVGG